MVLLIYSCISMFKNGGEKSFKEEKNRMKYIGIEDIKNHETFIKNQQSIFNSRRENHKCVKTPKIWSYVIKKVNYRKASKQFFKTKEMSY